MKRILAAGLVVLALVVAALFSLGVTGGHIGLDDWGYTGGCPFVRDGLSASNLARAFTDIGYGAIWMPVTFFSYMLDVSLFGGGWQVHHAVNVVLHVLNAILVLLFIREQLRLLSSASERSVLLASFAAALLWALHPLRAEAVTYVAGRKEELWTLFTLAGLLAYGRSLRGGSFVLYALTWAFFVLACLSKPTAMVFPLLAGALHAVHRLRRPGERTPSAWRLVPMLVFSAFIGLVALHSQAHPTAAVSVDIQSAGPFERILNAAVSLGLYAWHAVAPWVIHMDYRAVVGAPPIDCALGLSVLAVVGLVSVAVFLAGGREIRLRLAYGLVLYLLALGPTLGLFGAVNGDHAMADRYVYLPHVALALFVALGLASLLERRGGRSFWGCGLCVLALAGEVVVSVPVIRSYETGYTVFSRALSKDPDHWRALRFVGRECCTSPDRMDEGVAMLRRSLELRESQATAEALAYSLAIRAKDGDFDEVNRLCAGVIQKPARDQGGMMLDALGIVAMREGKYAVAAAYFAAGLRVRNRNHAPDHAVLNLGLCLANLGKDQEALSILRSAQACRHPWVRQRAAEAIEAIQKDSSRPPFRWE